MAVSVVFQVIELNRNNSGTLLLMTANFKRANLLKNYNYLWAEQESNLQDIRFLSLAGIAIRP